MSDKRNGKPKNNTKMDSLDTTLQMKRGKKVITGVFAVVIAAVLLMAVAEYGLPGQKHPMFPNQSSAEGIVLVLDPGHDEEYNPRNHPQLGVNEQDLNLAIALACKERLEQYEGVTVYMTRMDGSCPDREGKGENCVKARTDMTKQYDADLFVSIHCNGMDGVLSDTNPQGVEIYVSHYGAFEDAGKYLGKQILKKLNRCGLKERGVFTRLDSAKGKYEDGSTKDYYYLLSNNVDNGYPAILIEHGFMDNIHDNAILRDETRLQKMGYADGDALAVFYGLRKK